MNNKLNYLLIILVALIFVIVSFAKAQEQDRDKINKDIKTMEKILDKLLHKDSSPRHFAPHNTKGVYIPEFGLIFHVQQNPLERIRVSIFNNRQEYLEKLKPPFDTLILNDKKQLSKLKELKSEKGEKKKEQFQTENNLIILNGEINEINTDESQEKIIDNLKNDIFLFYKKYASSIRTLKENQTITVIIDLNHLGKSKTENSFLTSHTSYQVLEQYRTQKLTDQELQDKIIYSVSQREGDINTNIEIMKEILKENLNISSSFHRPLYNNGFYFHDFGVIFFLEIPEYTFGSPRYQMFFKKFGHSDIMEENKKQRINEESNLKSKISELKDNIFTVLASYGHTLPINPDEFIIMNIDLGENPFQLSADHPSGLTMKVKKQYLDDYYHGDLSKNNLQKKFVITSYFP